MAVETGDPAPEGEKLVAAFVNCFQVRMGPQVTRITLGEALTGMEANYHTAVVMLTSDAKELSDLITRMLEQLKGTP